MIADRRADARGARVPLLLCTATATHFTSLNSEWERGLGWTKEQLMSRPAADFIHPNDRDRTLSEAAKIGWPGYEVVNFENRFRASGGQWRRLRWSAQADGASWMAVAIDVTDEGPLEPPALAAGGAAHHLGVLAARVGVAVVCLVALLVAVRGIGSSSATGPAAEKQELLPHMFGPLDGGGLTYTLGHQEHHPPAMLGPRWGSVRPRG